MKQLAFKMYLNHGQMEEYQKRHEKIWPELKDLLKEADICEYSIFFNKEINTLLGFQKIKGNIGSQDFGEKEIIKKMVGLHDRHYENKSR